MFSQGVFFHVFQGSLCEKHVYCGAEWTISLVVCMQALCFGCEFSLYKVVRVRLIAFAQIVLF